MKRLPAAFTPGDRRGAGLDETLALMQRVCDEQGLAEPVTVRDERAALDLDRPPRATPRSVAVPWPEHRPGTAVRRRRTPGARTVG